MARVALLSPSVNRADAVSNDLLGMHRTLTARGHRVELFAFDSTVDVPNVRPFVQVHRYLEHPAAVLIYHHSISCWAGLKVLREARCPRVVKYHNVTPPEFFENYSHEFYNACQEGREELRDIALAGCDLYLSDSEYNLQELVGLGADEASSRVVPPFHQVERLDEVDADPAVNVGKDGTVTILAVGRLVPNKGHALLIDAFATYHHGYNRDSRLLIVGKHDKRLEGYARALRELVTRHGLGDAVRFTGEVSDPALKAYYQGCDLLLVTSLHEGFCVPLVEAMAMKVPVVALAAAAVPGTLGNAGLLWEEPDAELLAESIHTIVSEEETAAALGLIGWERYRQQFSNAAVAEQFLAAAGGLL
jgi:glycosyltransferase involved in cell wall biosynthesis